MGLGLATGSNGGGDIKPYVNYDAKAGRMFRVDRSQAGDGTWATDKVEITNTVQFVADLANIRVGWVNYTTQGPIRRFVTLGKEPMPARPDDKNAEGKPAFKQGFEIDIVLDKASGGGARVFGSAAGCVIEAMDALHDLYTNAAESKAGKLPAVKISGVSPVKSGQSTNYKPTFAIVGWMDRPTLLQAQAATKPATTSAPSTGSTQVAPPATRLPANQLAPQPAQADAMGDFG
jgi:hypothetical protein